MGNKRLITFDILKGIGILLVIVGHTFMKEIGGYIQAFHMPLFFIVAGYFYKHAPLLEQTRKDFRRLIVPYLVVVLSIALIACLKHYKQTHEVDLFLSTIYECGTPAWFLLALFGAKLWFNIIYIFTRRYYLLIAFVFSSIPCLISHFIEIDPFLSIGSSICGAFFYAVGYFTKVHDCFHKVKGYLPYAVVGSIVLWLNTSIFGAVDLHFCTFKLWFFDFMGACSGVYLCYLFSLLIEKRTEKIKTLLTKTGYYSFVIYSFHAIEYVFPDWHQIASFSDGTVFRPFVILFFRFLFAGLAVLITIRIPMLNCLFFPTFNDKSRK